MTSDAHKGLVSAIRRSFINASWQRCQVHFLRNILTSIPKKNSKPFREAVKAIFKFTDINLAMCYNIPIGEERGQLWKIREVENVKKIINHFILL